MKAKWLDSGEAVTAETLKENDVLYEYIDPSNYQEKIDSWKAERGYSCQDEVKLHPEMENLEAICNKFVDEHLHTDDEVRYVIEGEGVFDVRSKEDKWIGITVEAGDFIIVPANLHHRFYLTDKKMIRCLRLFKENPSWVPVYRNPEEVQN